MNRDSPSAAAWNAPLAHDAYLARRRRPPLADLDHLPLRDLAGAVAHFAASARGALFDYGCGGKPYRHCFAGCAPYVGADIVPGPEVDKVLPASGGTGEPADAYDCVLSSQVLEHVADPALYLREAFRILKPGGRLILTTHGMFLEHGCPHDYYRWTGYGIDRLVASQGFLLEETIKITAGARASIYLFHIAVETLRPPGPGRHFAAAVLRRVYRWTAQPLLNLLARFLEPRGFLPATAPEPIYIGVGLSARKPS